MIKLSNNKLTEKRYDSIEAKVSDCKLYNIRISSLANYLQVNNTLISDQKTYWFRGQGKTQWSLTPGALRYQNEKSRTNALKLLDDFKRYAPTKLKSIPESELKWAQKARHYGLPTRLLDWTQNPAIGLYFACENLNEDGVVFLFDPVDLNTKEDPDNPRIFDANKDGKKLEEYFNLKGRITSNGRYRTIAIDPVWNSERILSQKGTFALHGNRCLTLSQDQASSLIALPILQEDKESLLRDLEMIGIEEMSIFPEPEHITSYLKDKLQRAGGN